ncbi:MAG: hypothetical protein K8R23_17470 [Chthoniobacter sp.]|nr:hypothetical protein [Chthoniobacter sp.]
MKTTFFILASLPLLASAAEWHVDAKAGDNAADGKTVKTSWKTLTHAAKQIAPGDSIIVHEGVYFEQVSLAKAGTAEQPIRFAADKLAKNRVIISGADPGIRSGEKKWTPVEKQPQLFSIALDHAPARVLCDETDLFAYPSLKALKSFTLDGGIPGPAHGFAYDAGTGMLYVRLHTSAVYGAPDPNKRTMKVSPAGSGRTNAATVENAAWTVLGEGPSYVVLEGFTFETPALAGVFAQADNVTVRQCWFLGCRTGVAGRPASKADARRTNDVLIESCNFTQYPAYEDVKEVVARASTEKVKLPALYWQHRRSGPQGYDLGLALEIGTGWRIRGNYIHNVVNGLSSSSVASSRDLEVSENRFERVIRTAIHTGHHASGLRVYRNLIQDTFQPFVWKPEDGAPWPGPMWIYRNIILQSEDAQTLWARLDWRPGCFHLAVQDENWERPHMKEVPRETVALPGEGLVVYNNTIHFPHGTVFSFGGLGTRSVRNCKFFNNVCVASGLVPPAYGTFEFGGMEFAGNGVVGVGAKGSGPGEIFAGRGGKQAGSAKELGLADLLHGDVTLTKNSPAAGGGVELKNLRAASSDIGALKLGETFPLHASPSDRPKPPDR